MKFALSTNWCNRNCDDGAAIAEMALDLGFDALELGFRTMPQEVPGYKSMSARIPVGSVHAFCPVPVSAPEGHPELYTLASTDCDARAIARINVAKNIRFASSMGADTVVLHAGRIPLGSFFSRGVTSSSLHEKLSDCSFDTAARKYASALEKARRLRRERGGKMLEIFYGELDALLPVLEKESVTLAFENLPYLEGFPDETEMDAILAKYPSSPFKAWFDTGHHRVREMHGWLDDSGKEALARTMEAGVAGMHLNDVKDYFDDHFAPGGGKVDFAALKPLAARLPHVVFEPKSHVDKETLRKSVAFMRKLWED